MRNEFIFWLLLIFGLIQYLVAAIFSEISLFFSFLGSILILLALSALFSKANRFIFWDVLIVGIFVVFLAGYNFLIHWTNAEVIEAGIKSGFPFTFTTGIILIFTSLSGIFENAPWTTSLENKKHFLFDFSKHQLKRLIREKAISNTSRYSKNQMIDAIAKECTWSELELFAISNGYFSERTPPKIHILIFGLGVLFSGIGSYILLLLFLGGIDGISQINIIFALFCLLFGFFMSIEGILALRGRLPSL